ncbi:MAG TPA: UDP-N-acetylmuramoyl-L-alanine--D-glutamate ligase, partial [Parachlamydiaceae bacterium]|nr:UDP-N-acetylmuramoyl-L-alanine--D-glutamate ligase [Parachlamydiaceae bacterium]
AVTGTNGKTTVTLMTAHILETAGIKAKALGNVGIPLTSAVDALGDDKTDVFVIELSSFQLETLSKRFIDAAVILNITPDHLDRYPSLEGYAAAKIGMEKNLKETGKLFVENKCLKDFGKLFKERRYATYGYQPENYLYTDSQDIFHDGKQVLKVSDLLATGNTNVEQAKTVRCAPSSGRSHELENIMASYALCSTFSISPEDFLIGFGSFQKPSHRIEFVKTVDGVDYFDDSKGTNIDAVIRAVEVLNGDIILIAGGVDKGFPYTTWIDAFGGKVKAICAIGQAKEKMKNDLEKAIPVTLFSGLDEAIVFASSLAKSGDIVLLSPGCSSFDMFKDYVHRGLEFQRIVNGL